MKSFLQAVVIAALAAMVVVPSGAQTRDRRVVVITIDGLRWQEFFGGADRDYFKRDKKGDAGGPEQRFWRPTAEARRSTLMPFVWKMIAARGQIFGDASVGSESRLTNGLWFSYPGYNEMFAGLADPRIDSNNKTPNPNMTVLEWLHRRPGFEGRVAAFGAWDVLPAIVNTERSGIPVGTGWMPVPAPATERDRAINQLATDLPRYWDYGPFDAPIVYAAIEHLRTKRPRVLYIMLGEGDEWAHLDRYDLYLDAAQRADRFIERVWNTLQSMPEYRDRTALVITTDHGRGATTADWTDHGRDTPTAERTWIAVLGAGVPPLGVRRDVNVTTSQIAATISTLVDEDFRSARPSAAPPLPLAR
ncbi:MAG: alkaline phosphatase family protein [Vicinamibacterales bacterium]